MIKQQTEDLPSRCFGCCAACPWGKSEAAPRRGAVTKGFVWDVVAGQRTHQKL